MKYTNRTPEYRNAIDAAESETEYALPLWATRPPPSLTVAERLDLPGTAQKAIDVYLSHAEPSGLISDVGWWQNANGYTAIALKDLWIGEKVNTHSLAKLLRECAQSNPNVRGTFINVFNDDCCWWALCCLYVYTLTNDVWFLAQAEKVWRHVRKSMLEPGHAFYKGHDMHGAVFWTSKPDESSINSISTGLFAELSIRLALLKDSSSRSSSQYLKPSPTPSAEEYIDTTRKALGWIYRTRCSPESGTVTDHINLHTQKPDDRTFTYNAGVTLGTTALLYESTGDERLVTLACHMAYKAMTRAQWVDANGVLTEREVFGRGTHDPLQNKDGVGFKAVLMRQLSTLYNVIGRTKCTSGRVGRVAAMIHSFLYVNLHAQLEGNTDGEGRYGPWWNGPFEFPTNHSQMAVLDVMATAVLVNFG